MARPAGHFADAAQAAVDERHHPDHLARHHLWQLRVVLPLVREVTVRALDAKPAIEIFDLEAAVAVGTGRCLR
jgi:hypothetical protein